MSTEPTPPVSARKRGKRPLLPRGELFKRFDFLKVGTVSWAAVSLLRQSGRSRVCRPLIFFTVLNEQSQAQLCCCGSRTISEEDKGGSRVSPRPSRRLAEAAPTPPAPGRSCRQVSGAALRKGRSRDSRPSVRVGARGCAWVPCAPSPLRCFPAAPCPYPRFPEAVSVPDKASFIPAAALPRPSLPPPRIPDTRTERGVLLDGKTPSAHTHARARTHALTLRHTHTQIAGGSAARAALEA